MSKLFTLSLKLYKNSESNVLIFSEFWVCVLWTSCTTQNHSLEKWDHMDSVVNRAFHSASAPQLAYLFWLYLPCLCVSAASRGCCLATTNRRTDSGQMANAKSKLIIAQCKPNLRHTWFIWLANQSLGSTSQGKKAALMDCSLLINDIAPFSMWPRPFLG